MYIEGMKVNAKVDDHARGWLNPVAVFSLGKYRAWFWGIFILIPKEFYTLR